jgi:hypothetical protein
MVEARAVKMGYLAQPSSDIAGSGPKVNGIEISPEIVSPAGSKGHRARAKFKAKSGPNILYMSSIIEMYHYQKLQ